MQLAAKRLALVSQRLRLEAECGRIPGAVVAIGIGPDVHFYEHCGFAENLHDVCRPMTSDTLFDLASLTKVIATLPCVLSLIDDGHIRLRDALQYFLPGFQHETVTVKHLLTHTAGLPASRRYDQIYASSAEILAAAYHEKPETTPGAYVTYSDIGFILLGELIRSVTGKTLHQYAKERIYEPLGMPETGFCPPASLQYRCAATEETPERQVKVGVVHDENAQALDGVAGHAGLFAPMDDLIRYVQMWLNPNGRVLSQTVRQIAVQCHTLKLDGRRGLGWVCRHDGYDHTGDLWPEATVGHTGFTGTSLAFDPVSRLWMIILTNDVHYGRERKTIVRLRALLHNLVGSAIIN